MHKQQVMPLKLANVDEKIVPIIAWLNDHDSIFTLNCCEGNRGKKAKNKPYVQFISLEPTELVHVLRSLNGFALFELEYDEIRAAVIYVARFYDQDSMLEACEMVGSGGY